MQEESCLSWMSQACKRIEKKETRFGLYHFLFRAAYLNFHRVPSVAGQFALPIAVKSATIHRYFHTKYWFRHNILSEWFCFSAVLHKIKSKYNQQMFMLNIF